MSLQDTPVAERVHIAFFGVRNAGKSSVVNAVTGQDLSVVSDVPGTTTDPVRKTMELLPIGPVVITDTPGIDDSGALGAERVRRTKKILNMADIAVLVISAAEGIQDADRDLIGLFRENRIPFVIALNKTDLCSGEPPVPDIPPAAEHADPGPADAEERLRILHVSALTGEGIFELKEALGGLVSDTGSSAELVGDLAGPDEMVILVTPIDKAAPRGRLILPQQMVIRGLLDRGAVPVVVRDSEYPSVLQTLINASGNARENRAAPHMVITDSQVFASVASQTPEDIPLTSFSMLMARYKGTLQAAVRGARAIDLLEDGDCVLISEGCTHHRQCGDIGTVKLPGWLGGHTGKKLRYEFTSGNDFPDDLSPYALVLHCGGCMLNEREMKSRMTRAADEGIPFTNYGTAIAHMNGILDRCCSWILAKKHENS